MNRYCHPYDLVLIVITLISWYYLNLTSQFVVNCIDDLILLGLNITVVINIIDYLLALFEPRLINSLDQSVILVVLIVVNYISII